MTARSDDTYNPVLDEDEDDLPSASHAWSPDQQQGPPQVGTSASKLTLRIPSADPVASEKGYSASGAELATRLPAPDSHDRRSSRRGAAAPAVRSSRFTLEGKARDALDWFDKARYSTPEQLALFLSETRQQARARIHRLKQYGYLGVKSYAGFPLVYFLTPAAKDAIGSETPPVDPNTGPGFIRHTLLVGDIMLSLLLGEGELYERLRSELPARLTLDDFISESELAQYVRAKRSETARELEQATLVAKGNTVVKPWQVNQALALEAAGERWRGDPWTWALFTLSNNQPHLPDLVLALPRAGEEPGAIAFEAERSRKPRSLHAAGNAYVTNFEQSRLLPHLSAEHFNGDTSAAQAWEREKGSRTDTRAYRRVLWICEDRKVLADAQSMVQQSATGLYAVPDGAVRAWKAQVHEAHDEAHASRRAIENAAASAGYWHLTTHGQARPCSCGTTCRARFGRYETELEATEAARRLG